MLLIAHGKTAGVRGPGRVACAVFRGASIRCIALAAALALPAQAAEKPAELAAAVLDIERQAQSLPAPADARRLNLYIGNQIEDSLLREVTVMVDGRVVMRHRYSDREARALRGSGLHALALPLEEGPHRLRVEAVARAEDAQAADARLHAQAEREFQKAGAAGSLELSLQKQGLRGKAALLWQDGVAALEDPRLRAAGFLLRSGQPLAAALALERLRGEGGPLPASFDRRMADSLAALELAPAASPAAAPSLERHGRAFESLRQGDAAAATQLEALGAAEATDPETMTLRDYANLELGYQLLRQGEGERAKPVFARIRSPGPCSNAALLGFGWSFLVPKGEKEAGTMFSAQAPLWPASTEDAARLRRAMPFRYLHSVAQAGERKQDLQAALIPWVELLGRDATDPAVQEGLLAVPYALAHLGAYQQSQQYLRRAIGDLERARIDLDKAMQHVSSGELAARLQERMTDDSNGWRRELADLPYADATAYLKPLMQDPAFLVALSELQQLAAQEQALQAQAQRLEGVAGAEGLLAQLAGLRQRVGGAVRQQDAELRGLVLARLRAQQQHTQAYLAEARLALARVHDRPLEEEAS